MKNDTRSKKVVGTDLIEFRDGDGDGDGETVTMDSAS